MNTVSKHIGISLPGGIGTMCSTHLVGTGQSTFVEFYERVVPHGEQTTFWIRIETPDRQAEVYSADPPPAGAREVTYQNFFIEQMKELTVRCELVSWECPLFALFFVLPLPKRFPVSYLIFFYRLAALFQTGTVGERILQVQREGYVTQGHSVEPQARCDILAQRGGSYER